MKITFFECNIKDCCGSLLPVLVSEFHLTCVRNIFSSVWVAE